MPVETAEAVLGGLDDMLWTFELINKALEASDGT